MFRINGFVVEAGIVLAYVVDVDRAELLIFERITSKRWRFRARRPLWENPSYE